VDVIYPLHAEKVQGQVGSYLELIFLLNNTNNMKGRLALSVWMDV
jgi:hypothetical protein